MSDTDSPLRPRQTTPQSLDDLAARFELSRVGEIAGISVRGITVGTADVHAGDVFVGLPGSKRHGAEFAVKAREAGAAALLTDPAGAEVARDSGLPILVATEPRAILGAVSAWIYQTTAIEVPLFAVTGTNGKTSAVYFMAAILRQLGIPAGLSSTAERQVGKATTVSGLTTPEAPELHGMLARMVEDGVEAIAIEVSAQALTRRRVGGVNFDVAGFTNLSHDHLDDYSDMPGYLRAKAALFQDGRARRAVISIDSTWGTELLGLATVPFATISSDPAIAADWQIAITGEGPDGVSFTLTAREGGSVSTSIPVIGRQMAANAGLAIAMLAESGVSLSDISAAIESGIEVHIPGRIEKVSGDNGPSLFVDFGHGPDAFITTLDAVRHVTEGRILMVFGASGDRDKTKRPAMAQAAVERSDILIITDHHTRFEDGASIRATLLDAARRTDPGHETLEEPDPSQAIRAAVRLAREGDSILWSGPGHLDYRDVRGVKIPFSARDEAREALREAGWPIAP